MELAIFTIDILTFVFPQRIAKKLSEFIAIILLKVNPKYTLDLISSVQKAFPLLQPSVVKKIVFNSQKNHLSIFSTYRYLALKPLKKIKPILKQVDILGKEHIDTLTKLNRPVVIVSIHMGDFFKGFLKLATLAPRTKEIGIIKWMNSSKKEEAAYKKFKDLGANLKLFRLRNKPGLEAVRFLKRGNVLLTLCDISPKFVKTTEISFFNKKTQFPCGPAELAVASQAIILPVYVTKLNEREFLKICPPIDTTSTLTQNESLSEKSKKITHQLASLVEEWIYTHPDQWHFWGIMEELWTKQK
ncbi:hypothetical protein DID76_03085 [Candidatus Marinamargulisbacteria bacterium SCGC AG-414-C22]|nr:hypothetical protein DID76_03085 [Candidatus Marinamargulisbacteria bacterium SCGC AG-414-C22]